MAFHISKYVGWRAGASSSLKYAISFELDCEMTEQTPTTATFRLTGEVVVTNYPDGPHNSWAASDFAVLTLGGYDPNDYPFTKGVSYYESELLFLPNAPQSYKDAIQMEFRGDTYTADGANRVSFITKGSSPVIVNKYSGSTPRVIDIDQTFTINLTGNPSQEVLIYVTSGANNSTDYNWLQHETWASLFNFDYRPSAVHNGSTLLSCNRASGARNIYTPSGFSELRAEGGPDATGNPPGIVGASGLRNQSKVGQE